MFVLNPPTRILFLKKVLKQRLPRTKGGTASMSRGPSKGRSSVLRRTISGMKSAGLEVGRIEAMPDGRWIITPRSETVSDANGKAAGSPANDTDEWKVE